MKKIDSKKYEEYLMKKSLRYSIFDGSFYSFMVGFGESFFSAFAIFLKATSTQIGLLGSLPQLIGSLAQFISNKLLRLFASRKKFVLTCVLLQALMYLPILLVFYFGEFNAVYLIIFVCIYWIFGALPVPAWSSWMGDLVDINNKGSYFGTRNKIAGYATFIALLAGGYILQKFQETKYSYYGFGVIFCLALISRIICLYYLSKQFEPKYETLKESEFSFLEFIKQASHRNFGIFVIYTAFMNFAVFIAAPFTVAYMLNDLHMSIIIYTILTAIMLIVKYLAMPIWGKACDRFGTRKVLVLSGMLVPLSILLWLFSENYVYLAIIQALGGFIWAGYEISTFNYIFDATSSEKRTTCIAYYNILNGIGIFLGGIVGSVLVYFNHFYWSVFLFVFLISGILRFIISLIFVGKIKEIRNVEKIAYPRLFLNIVSTMPTMGIINNMFLFIKEKIKK